MFVVVKFSHLVDFHFVKNFQAIFEKHGLGIIWFWISNPWLTASNAKLGFIKIQALYNEV